MLNVFARKLETFGLLPEADRSYLVRVTAKVDRVPAHTDIISEGDTPGDVHLIVGGFAIRYKILNNGRRQIIAFVLPGDVCDLNMSSFAEMDYSIAALSNVDLVRLSREAVLGLLDRPAVARALRLAALVDEALLREWLVNLGQRPAEQRLAHLFCELHLRLTTIGLARDGEIELPLTQAELADTTGLSTVHVNRSLQNLRARGLIVLNGKRLKIPDIEELRHAGGFRPNYLHLSPNLGGLPH